LFGQAGIIATHSLGELVDAAALLASQPLPAGRRVAIVSNAGGTGVLAADACGDSGLTVAVLGARTQRRLAGSLPVGATVTGPVDTTATVSSDGFRACLEAVAADDSVDALLALGVPTAIADLSTAILTAQVDKPMAAVLLDRPEAVSLGSHAPADGSALAPPSGLRLPIYSYPESAARALSHAASYREWRDSQQGQVPELAGVDQAGAHALVSAFLADYPAGGWLANTDAVSLLRSYGIPMVDTRTATDQAEAVAVAAELGGHVVLKGDVPGLVRKSDVGAVKLDLRTAEEVASAYADLAAAFGTSLHRVLVQPMLADGVETLIGVVQEPVFGPLVVFGLGGVATDVLGDHSARLAPLTDVDAKEMIRGVRAAPLLFGLRAWPAVDTAALADLLLRVSRLADDLPEMAELDLNPVIARPDGAHAVDTRIRIAPATPRDPFLRQLR
jgi:acyl-CoA synthetase (NDP forming)